MGQRADLIVIENGNAEIYYTHHRANTLDHDLFWGPRYALGFIRAQRRMETGELLDDVWAEGGAVMDLDRKRLHWFGGEDIISDVSLRRVHGQLLAKVWSGWIVRWAEGGVADIAGGLGIPLTKVLSANKEPPAVPWGIRAPVATETDPDMSHSVASVRTSDGDIRLAMLHGPCGDLLYCGPDLASAIEDSGWPTYLELNWFRDCIQDDGLHIDARLRRIDFWTASPIRSADVQRRVASCWPGWTVKWHGSRFESQIELTEGRLRIELPTCEQQIDKIRSWLLRPDGENRTSGAQAVVSAAKAINEQTGITVTGINPLALFDAQLSIPLEIRKPIFDAAVAALQ
jgi:hypothetical protein